MLHLVLYVLLAIIVAVGLFLAATRFLPAGEQIAPAIRDEPVWELPAERSLRPEDVDTVRLPVALRGYRFAETDVLLDRLAGELRVRDAEIARLRGETPPAAGPIGDVASAAHPQPDADAAYAPDAEPGTGAEPAASAELETYADPAAIAEPENAVGPVPIAGPESTPDADARFAPPPFTPPPSE